MTERKIQDATDARKREVEGWSDENKREKRELEHKTDEFLALLRKEKEFSDAIQKSKGRKI